MQSLLSFMLPLGETVGISMMGSVFSNKLDTFLSQINREGGNAGAVLPVSGIPSLALLNSLPPDAKERVQDAAAKAVMWALVSVLPFVGLAIVAAAFMGNVWIGRVAREGKEDKETVEAEKGKVLYGVYLLALFTGNVEECKMDLDVNRGHEEVERSEPEMRV